MQALNRLRESTTSLAGAAASIGAPTPTDPLTAQAMGVSPNAAQMAGTPANKLSALRNSMQEDKTQGMDQKQEDHSKETYLSQRLKQDAVIAATTGKLTDRVAQNTADQVKATSTVLPIEDMLPKELKGDLGLKTAVTSFLNPSATPQERDAAIRTLVAKSESKLSYDDLATKSSIQGMTVLLRGLGVVDVTEEAVSSSIVASFPPALPINQILTPSNPSNWEAVFGPGAPPTALTDFLTATGANPNDTWSSLGPKLKEWQQGRQQDWTTLQEQARSTNAAVRTEANEKLRTLGFLGVEPAVERIAGVTQSIEQGGQFLLGTTSFDTEKLRAGDPQQKSQLKDLLTQAVAGTLTDKTLEAQLKGMMKNGTLEGLIDQNDVAAVQAVSAIHEQNKTLFTGPNPTTDAFTPAFSKDFLSEELYKDLTEARRVVPKTELPAWMQTLQGGGNEGAALKQVMSSANQYPALKAFIVGATPQQMAASPILTNPQVVVFNFAEQANIQTLLSAVQGGNVGAEAQLSKAIFGDNQSRISALSQLPPMFRLNNLEGIPLGSAASMAGQLLTGPMGPQAILNSTTAINGLKDDVEHAAQVANSHAAQLTEQLNPRIQDLQTKTKARDAYQKVVDTENQKVSAAQAKVTTLQQQLSRFSNPNANAFGPGQAGTIRNLIAQAQQELTQASIIRENVQRIQDGYTSGVNQTKTSAQNFVNTYGSMMTLGSNGLYTAKTY